MSNEPLSIQYSKLGHQWAALDSAASMLEELKSATLSQWMLSYGDIPVSRAEMQAKASSRWQDYLKKMVDARTAANHAKVDMEALRMKFQEYVSEEANNRAQVRL